MKISVIIPARDEAAAFQLTLQFLANLQRQTDLEVIVVDDASHRPVQVLSSMKLVRNKTRQGIAKSRNAGARIAAGDLLLHTDGHVFFSDNALDHLVDAFDEQHYFGVRTQLINKFAQFQDQQTEATDRPEFFGWKWVKKPALAVAPIPRPLSTRPHEVPFVGCACLAVPRKLFEALGGFDEGLIESGNFEDAEFAMSAWAMGYKVRLLPSVTCYHYSAPQPNLDHPDQSLLDSKRYSGSLHNAFRILRRHLPTDDFHKSMMQVARQFPLSWSSLPEDFITQILKTEDPAWESQRVRSREWVAQRMFTAEEVMF